MNSIPELGQRYRDVEARLRTPDWIVARVFTGTDGVEYAWIESTTDRTRRKTLALTILMDPRHFMLLDETARQKA
jgi:hypothetical protein